MSKSVNYKLSVIILREEDKRLSNMRNETEFLFDETLLEGFTTTQNYILNDNRVSNKALGLYMRIIQKRNIPGWKVYQSTLITDKDGKTSIASAMKELIDAGYITKKKNRNKKGHLIGIIYTVHSKSVDITTFEPKADFPTSVFPKSVFPKSENEQLKNKDYKKERKKKERLDKINTTRKKKDEESSSSNYNNDVIDYIEGNTNLALTNNMKNIQVASWKIDRTIKAVDIFNDNYGETFAFLKKIYYDNNNFTSFDKKTLKTDNFVGREYNDDILSELEKQLNYVQQ